MGEKIDSSKWTGEIPEREQPPLDSQGGRKVVRGVSRNLVVAIACSLALALLLKVFS